jgi:hypothetical protein
VSVEVLEDVAVENRSAEVDAVQLKSAAKSNPISNRSLDLWKTIANWMSAVEKKELTVDRTTFHLRLGRKRSGPICESFSEASTLNSVRESVENARREFFTSEGKLKKSVPENLRETVEVVFAPQRAGLLEKIITRFRLSFGGGYAYDELLDHLKTKLIDDDVAEDVLLHALGWVKKKIDNAVERDEPPIIEADDFRSEVSSFRNRLRNREYLPSFAGPPSLEEIELQKLRLFVRQMEIVEFSEERILEGITDFLTAKTNRIKYAMKGAVHSDSFREFEDALKSLWRNHRDELELDKTEAEIIRGQRLALRCLRENLRLQGIEVPADFVRGCFHNLADKPSIGWHPRYELLLAAPRGN